MELPFPLQPGVENKIVAAAPMHAHVEFAEWVIQGCTGSVQGVGPLLGPLQPLAPGRQPLPRLFCGRVLGGKALVLQQRTCGAAAHLHHPVKFDLRKLFPPEHGHEGPVIGVASQAPAELLHRPG